MKKIFTLLVACCATLAVMAETKIVLTPADQTPVSGGSEGVEVKVQISGVNIQYVGSLLESDFRIFGGKSLTLSTSVNITKVEIAGKNSKVPFTCTTSAGTITTGQSYDKVTTADPLIVVENINSKSVTLEMAKQVRATTITVYVEGEITGGGDDDDDPIVDDDDDPIVDDEDPYYYENFGEVGTYTETMTYADYVFYSEDGILDLYMENENSAAEFLFFTEKLDNNTVIPVGTYPINDSEEPNTFFASLGGDDLMDFPAYFALFDETGEYYTPYYLVDGTVIVTAENNVPTITVNAKSYYGSTINLTYTGELVEYIDDTAVENVTMENKAARKVMENGNIYIIRDNVKYNVLGGMVK